MYFFSYSFSQRRHGGRDAGDVGFGHLQHFRIVHQVDAYVRRVYPERPKPSQWRANDVVEHLRQCSGVLGHHVPDASLPSYPQGRIVVGLDQCRNILGRLSNSQTPLENQS